MVEQLYNTTNPIKNGFFGICAKTPGVDKYQHFDFGISSALLCGGTGSYERSYEPVYRNKKVLRPDVSEKRLKSGKFRDKDYMDQEILFRGPVEVVYESFPGSLTHNLKPDADYRNDPENAPYRIAKCTLGDGRIYVTCLTAIGKAYGESNPRGGNFFEHSFIFPAGTKLTNEQILKLPFKKGFTQEEQINGIDEKLPTLNENQLLNPTSQQNRTNAQPAQQNRTNTQSSQQNRVNTQPPQQSRTNTQPAQQTFYTNMPKTIRYGSITFTTTGVLGEIEKDICDIGLLKKEIVKCEKIPTFDEFAEKNRVKYSNSLSLMKVKYDLELQNLENRKNATEDILFKKNEALKEKMDKFLDKNTLNKYLEERRIYYRDMYQKDKDDSTRQDDYAQYNATIDAQRTFTKIESKEKNDK